MLRHTLLGVMIPVLLEGVPGCSREPRPKGDAGSPAATSLPSPSDPLILVVRSLGGGIVWWDENPVGEPLLSVRVTYPTLTDERLRELVAADRIRGLYIPGTAVTDAGLAHLRGLTRLRHLNLDETGVTDAGLAHLRGVPDLESLTLENTAVTDRGLEHLTGLKKLEKLHLRGTRVTDGGVAALQKALPELKIIR
jgi:hypothetical protein